MSNRSLLRGALRLSARQVEMLISPIRLELVEAVAALGPCTAGQLAKHTRRSPGSVFHQVRLLERAGLLRAAGRRPTLRRPETLYELVAPRMAVVGGKSTGKDARASRAIHAILRRAGREAEAFAKRSAHYPPGALYGTQLVAALRPAAQRNLRRHLHAIEDLLRRANRRGDPQADIFCWTTLLVPLQRGRRS